jgi:hypothetical protein
VVWFRENLAHFVLDMGIRWQHFRPHSTNAWPSPCSHGQTRNQKLYIGYDVLNCAIIGHVALIFMCVVPTNRLNVTACIHQFDGLLVSRLLI